MPNSTDIILSANDLCKTYGKGDTLVRALDHVSLQVPRGQFLAVTGESGSGKTTLLNTIGALDPPTSGTVTVNGQDILKGKDKQLSEYRRRNTGFVFQSFHLIPVLNVEENITLPLSLDGKQPDPQALAELLGLLGLTDRRYHFPHQLSGGQQQRVSIGRALMANPPLLFADEPTGNLDSATSRDIIALLKQSIATYHQTLILITHDPAIAAQADRVLVMQDGKITSDSLPCTEAGEST